MRSLEELIELYRSNRRAQQPAPRETVTDLASRLAGAATDKEFWKDIGKGLFNQELPKPANTYAEMQQMWKDDPSRRLNQVMGVAGFAPLAATVFHGSPHNFSKFDASKIGTGEGAQAYGHGIYLADNPNAAGQYRNIGADETRNLERHMAAELAKPKPDMEWVAKARQRIADRKGAGIDKDVYGNLYKVDLPDSAISKMLDWDKPLSQQQEVLEKLKPFMAKETQSVLHGLSGRDVYNSIATGRNHRNFGGFGVDQEAASKVLKQAGIPGIRYLDQGSRATGKGTYNYVVFPGGEDMLKILGRE